MNDARPLNLANHPELQLQLMQFAMENASIEIYWLDSAARICYANDHACKTLGYTKEEFLRLSLSDLDPNYPIELWPSHWESLKHDKTQSFETQHKRKDGEIFPVEVVANYVCFSGHEYNVGFAKDITQRKKAEEEINHLAFFDTLTQLPNRRLLDDRLSQAIASCARKNSHGALLFLDLDNFKPVNDTHGHAAGDLLLIEAANRLTHCVREIDTVARFGGDEFVVVLHELSQDHATSCKQTAIIAEKIRASLSAPYRLTIRPDGIGKSAIEHQITVSIGALVFSNHEGSKDDLLKWADIAMYRAKAEGRNAIRFYDFDV